MKNSVNESSLDQNRKLDLSSIKSDKYFESLVSSALAQGLISQERAAELSSELFAVLCDICFSIAQKGSSSIKTETAREISDSICYCIGIRLKSENNANRAVALLKEEKVEKLYYDGLIENDRMLKRARMKYSVLKKKLFKTPSVFYNETINDGLKAFFSSYDQREAAHKSVILFDYPLYCDIEPLCGAEYVCKRLDSLILENEFCLCFDPETVDLLMLSLCGGEDLDGDYRELPINIYSYVLFQALGLEMCQKDIFALDLDDYEIGMIEKTLRKKSRSEIYEILTRAKDGLLEKLSLGDDAKNYVSKSISKLAFELSALGARNVPNLFLNRNRPKELPKKSRKTDLLSDESFAALLTKLKNTVDEEKQVSLICQSVRSDRDFDDLAELANLDVQTVRRCIEKAPQRLFLRIMHKYRVCRSDDNEKTAKAVEAVFESMGKKNAEKLDEILFSM